IFIFEWFFAAVVKEYGYEGVTVERIAGELNMAKSSLYNYFGNKDELIKELVEDELILMSDFVYSMCNLTNNISEYVYMHMRSQIAYFLHRPFLLPVCYWLFLRGFKPEKFFLHEKLKKRKDFFRDIPMPNMGFPVTGFLLSGWFFLLAGFVMDLKHAGFFSDAEVIEYIKKYHYFIGRGLQSVFEQTEDNDAAL
ncbi:MAG: helix-turn-helix domain-containing protein, partial [Spirochaetales bacterium]